MPKKDINYFLVVLGLIIIILFIYFRVIMQRLPKDMTFEYSLLKTISLSCITFAYLYHAGINKFFKGSQKLQNIIVFFEKPFWELYFLFLKWDQSKNIFRYLGHNLDYYCSFWIPPYQLQYIFFSIMPRIFVAIALYIDIYNLYFCYFYRLAPLLLIPLNYTYYLKASLKFFKENFETLLWPTYNFPWLFDSSYDVVVSYIDAGNLGHYYFDFQPWIDEKFRDVTILNNALTYYFPINTQIAYTKILENLWFNLTNKFICIIFASEWGYISVNVLSNYN